MALEYSLTSPILNLSMKEKENRCNFLQDDMLPLLGRDYFSLAKLCLFKKHFLK